MAGYCYWLVVLNSYYSTVFAPFGPWPVLIYAAPIATGLLADGFLAYTLGRGGTAPQRRSVPLPTFGSLWKWARRLGMFCFGLVLVDVLIGRVFFCASHTWYFWIGQGACQIHYDGNFPRWGWRLDPPYFVKGPAVDFGWILAVLAYVWLVSLGRRPLVFLARDLNAGREWLRYPRGHCQECGYDLTGNVSGRCPECGQDIKALSSPAATETQKRSE